MEQDILQRSDFFDTKCVKNVLESMCLGPCKLYSCNAGDQSSILGQEDLLEEGMATHSSILARRIPWTEESGGLQFMALRRQD